MKALRITSTLLFIAVIIIFATAPSRFMQSFFDGITIWAYNVLPALFPFAVLSTLALKVKRPGKFSITKKLFGTSCDSLFLNSLLCGYPIGAKAISDSNADKDTAAAISSFCSTAGPVFMLATVGAKLLNNTAATIIVITTHFAAAIINGLIYRNRKTPVKEIDNSTSFSPKDVGETITNSALAVISVGGLIALFYMLSDMIKYLLPHTLKDNLVISFAMGLFEMTNGIFGICKTADLATATVLSCALLSFGGLCVFLQCYAFLGNKGVKASTILKMKITQAAVATILSYVLAVIFL